MDRRTFVSTAALVGTAVIGSADHLEAAAELGQSPERSLIADLKGLECWARVMRQQFEVAERHGGAEGLHRHVLPSVAPWFGKILGQLAAMKQV